MTFREDEGLTCILPPDEAPAPRPAGRPRLPPDHPRRHSSLEAVGLTAAVAGRADRGGISANVVAAFHHDHVFVPAHRAAEALACLERLRDGSRNAG